MAEIGVKAELLCTMPEAEQLAKMIHMFLESYPTRVLTSSIVVTVAAQEAPNWPFERTVVVGERAN